MLERDRNINNGFAIIFCFFLFLQKYFHCLNLFLIVNTISKKISFLNFILEWFQTARKNLNNKNTAIFVFHLQKLKK